MCRWSLCRARRACTSGAVIPALGPRLHALAELVLPDAPALDIGTDHARLPGALVASGRVPAAIASDLGPGPLRAAAATIARLGLEDRISLRCADGLRAIAPGEVATIIIAGMGPDRIAAILATDRERRLGARRLVLGPNYEPGALRRWLVAHGHVIVDERLARERGRFYVAIAAEPGAGPPLGTLELEVGPFLLARGGPELARLARRELALCERAAAGMRRARAEPAQLAGLLARRDLWHAALANAAPAGHPGSLA